VQQEVAGACQFAGEPALRGFVDQSRCALAHRIEGRQQCGDIDARGTHPFTQQRFRPVHAQHQLAPIHVDAVMRAKERGFQWFAHPLC
jgi:hypothetical protein